MPCVIFSSPRLQSAPLEPRVKSFSAELVASRSSRASSNVPKASGAIDSIASKIVARTLYRGKVA